MQTLLPTPNDLAPTQTDVRHQRSDPSRITSEADRPSFTQIMKQTQRPDPPGASAGDDRGGPQSASRAVRDRGDSKPTSTDQPVLTRGQPSTDEQATQLKVPEEGRSTPSDSVERPAQNDGVSAQELPADSAVSGEEDVAKEPAQPINPKTIEPAVLPNVRIDTVGIEQSDAPAPPTAIPAGPSESAPTPPITTESTPATSTPVEAARAPAVDGAPSQTSTPVPNETASASRIGVVDDRTQLGTDSQVTANSTSSATDQSNGAVADRMPEAASDSIQSPPTKSVKVETPPPPSPSPDQSGNGQVLVPSPLSGERGTASHEARPLDIDRAPQDGARLQSPGPQSQSETSQDSRSNDDRSQQRSDQSDRPRSSGESTQRAPASARAVQIDAAVRVDNATAQASPVQSAVSLPVEWSSPTNTTTGATKESPTPSTPTRSADPSNDPFTARILRGLSATLNQRGGVLTMRLDPPQLGQLRIQMTITQGTVSAEFQTSTPQAQALLERSLAVLRSALQAHGLTVERLTVHTTQQANAQVMRQDSPEQQTQQDRERADAGKGESRGRRDGDQTDSFRRTMPRPTGEYAAFDVSPQPAGAD